jgi:hypothetical protein
MTLSENSSVLNINKFDFSILIWILRILLCSIKTGLDMISSSWFDQKTRAWTLVNDSPITFKLVLIPSFSPS